MSEAETDESYPGQSLGLPESGAGSLAPWGARLSALLIDWSACMIVAMSMFGVGVLTERGWRSWMILACYFVEKSLLTALTGSSFGQLITKVGVTRLGGGPLEWWRAVVRTLSVCLVVPAIVIGAERRGLNDILLGTVVVRRR